jgi:hypothetical protein
MYFGMDSVEEVGGMTDAILDRPLEVANRKHLGGYLRCLVQELPPAVALVVKS